MPAGRELARFVYPGDALKRNTKFFGRFALSAVAAAVLCLTAPSASALGLGRLSVQSALGESLRAEIEVTSMTPEEASSLRIQVAPPDSYRAANVDYNPVLPSTKAVLQRRPDGRSFIRLTSDRGVQEPFVDVILEISWPTGRLVREYTLLFDPPATLRAATAPASAAVSPPTAPLVAATPAAQPPMPAAAERPGQRRAPAAKAMATDENAESRLATRAQSANVDEYRVRSGDSLSRIASRTQRPGASLDQMLVALFHANPQAFQGENMNRLRAGAVRSIPATTTAQSVALAEAQRIIVAQSADFAAYRQRLAGAAPAAPNGENARQSSGTVQAAVEDRKQTAAATPDKLTLSKGTAAAKGALPEERLSKERERKEAAVQVAELSKNVEELKQMSSAAAAAASQAATPAAAGRATTPTATSTPALGVPAPAGVVVPGAAPAVAAAASPAASATSVASPGSIVAAAAPAAAAAASVPALAASAAASNATAAAVVAKPASALAAAPLPRSSVTRPAESPGLLGSLMDDNRFGLGLGALLVALLAGFGIYRFSKRARKDSGETSFLESRLQPDSFFGASGGQRIDTRDTHAGSSSMTYSLSQLDAIGDVDPVAEADVYLAYGRDLQAEEILKEAMRSNPNRMAIRTKLLEVYAKRRDTKGFELLATQLHALTGGEGEDWAKAQELGAQIDPENPLFHPGGMPAGRREPDAAPEPLGASTLPQSVAPVQSDDRDGIADDAAYDADAGLDLDLDDPDTGRSTSPGILEATQALAPDPVNDSGMLHTATHKMPLVANELPASQPDARDEPLAYDLSGIMLDLDTPTTSPAVLDGGEASFDGDAVLAIDDDEHLDPVSRKLELAEEFRQIGDSDGARDLLREVLENATGAAQTKAQGMLDDLG